MINTTEKTGTRSERIRACLETKRRIMGVLNRNKIIKYEGPVTVKYCQNVGRLAIVDTGDESCSGVISEKGDGLNGGEYGIPYRRVCPNLSTCKDKKL